MRPTEATCHKCSVALRFPIGDEYDYLTNEVNAECGICGNYYRVKLQVESVDLLIENRNGTLYPVK